MKKKLDKKGSRDSRFSFIFLRKKLLHANEDIDWGMCVKKRRRRENTDMESCQKVKIEAFEVFANEFPKIRLWTEGQKNKSKSFHPG